MINKFIIESNESCPSVLHSNTDREIYFLLKDSNHKETWVSVSEIYRVLTKVETLLGRDKKDDKVVIKTSVYNAYGNVYFVKERDDYYMTLDDYGGGNKVSISKELFEEARKIDWNDSE